VRFLRLPQPSGPQATSPFFEVEAGHVVTTLAVRHEREDDYM